MVNADVIRGGERSEGTRGSCCPLCPLLILALLMDQGTHATLQKDSKSQTMEVQQFPSLRPLKKHRLSTVQALSLSISGLLLWLDR